MFGANKGTVERYYELVSLICSLNDAEREESEKDTPDRMKLYQIAVERKALEAEVLTYDYLWNIVEVYEG